MNFYVQNRTWLQILRFSILFFNSYRFPLIAFCLSASSNLVIWWVVPCLVLKQLKRNYIKLKAAFTSVSDGIDGRSNEDLPSASRIYIGTQTHVHDTTHSLGRRSAWCYNHCLSLFFWWRLRAAVSPKLESGHVSSSHSRANRLSIVIMQGPKSIPTT